MKVLEASLSFAEIDADAERPPEAWVKKFGRTAAEKRFRLAKAAWSGKEVPYGLKLAQNIISDIVKARAMAATTRVEKAKENSEARYQDVNTNVIEAKVVTEEEKFQEVVIEDNTK